MSIKGWVLITTIMLVGLASAAGVILAQGRSGETASGSATLKTAAGLDPNYDDSWTRNIPATINGFEVLFVTTPRNQACSYVPIVHLKTAHSSIEEYLDQSDTGSVLNAVRAIRGVPSDVTVSFSGPSASTERFRASVEEWNSRIAKLGCPAKWGPKPELGQP